MNVNPEFAYLDCKVVAKCRTCARTKSVGTFKVRDWQWDLQKALWDKIVSHTTSKKPFCEPMNYENLQLEPMWMEIFPDDPDTDEKSKWVLAPLCSQPADTPAGSLGQDPYGGELDYHTDDVWGNWFPPPPPPLAGHAPGYGDADDSDDDDNWGSRWKRSDIVGSSGSAGYGGTGGGGKGKGGYAKGKAKGGGKGKGKGKDKATVEASDVFAAPLAGKGIRVPPPSERVLCAKAKCAGRRQPSWPPAPPPPPRDRDRDYGAYYGGGGTGCDDSHAPLRAPSTPKRAELADPGHDEVAPWHRRSPHRSRSRSRCTDPGHRRNDRSRSRRSSRSRNRGGRGQRGHQTDHRTDRRTDRRRDDRDYRNDRNDRRSRRD